MERIKTFDELTIRDNFLFQHVMRNERLCKHLIEKFLNIQIRSLQYQSFEKTIDLRLEGKSIRLDVFVEDNEEKQAYENGISIQDLFDVSGTGVLTKRDNLCVQFDEASAFQAAKDFLEKPREYVVDKYSIPKDVRDWKYEWAKEDLVRAGLDVNKVLPITYRPFDTRYVYYTGISRGFMGWPVYAVMQNLINEHENVALVTARSNKAKNSSHFYVSRNIVEYKCGERTTNSSVFPLYKREDGSFEKTPNFKHDVLMSVAKKMGMEFSETIVDGDKHFNARNMFAYIYAVLYSPTYRSEYEEFLNRDFPVVPYPKDKKYFWDMVSVGERLINLHLLDKVSNDVDVVFKGEDRQIQSVSYQDSKVYINRTSYFDNVEVDDWGFIVGGYQPSQRWLKERKGMVLTENDIHKYSEIVNVFHETRAIMREIDDIYIRQKGE